MGMVDSPAVKLLVLGGTGGTGRQIVQQALDAGHEVTVFVRDPAKAPEQHARLRIVQGDIANTQALADAVRGQDAVISALGRGLSFKSEHLIENSVPHILKAMASAGVKRLILTSAWGVGDTYNDASILPRMFFSTLLRGIYADKLAGDQLIRNSALDWTIVLPTKMHDGPLTRTYRTIERGAIPGMPSISRADTAHFILSRLADPSSIRKSLVVTD